jgi:hypothetical protein
MISASGTLQRIANDGGTDVNPSGIASLAIALDGLSPTLAMACSAGKVSTLFAHYSFKSGAGGNTTGVLSEADAEAFDAVSDYFIDTVPDIVAERNISGVEVALTITNGGDTDAKYYKSAGVIGNFTSLATVAPASDYAYADMTVTATVDYKYKASFIVNGTRNGSPHTVEGQRSPARYVIAVGSTL